MVNRRTSLTRSVEPNIRDSRERPTPLVFEELNFFPQLCCSFQKKGKANPLTTESDFFPNFPSSRHTAKDLSKPFPTPSLLYIIRKLFSLSVCLSIYLKSSKIDTVNSQNTTIMISGLRSYREKVLYQYSTIYYTVLHILQYMYL